MTCFSSSIRNELNMNHRSFFFSLRGLSVGVENYNISGHYPLEGLLIVGLSLINVRGGVGV